MEISKKIKFLRKEAGLTLADLSQRTAIAQSTLSRIESGIRTGNVKTHIKICEALGIKISDLYTGLETPNNEEISTIKTGSRDVEGFRYDEKAFAVSLARDLFKKRMKPELLIIAPSKTANEPGDPIGTEKFIFCQDGLLEVRIDKTRHSLKKGDTLYFNSSLPHYFKNTGKTTAKCIVVSSPVRV